MGGKLPTTKTIWYKDPNKNKLKREEGILQKNEGSLKIKNDPTEESLGEKERQRTKSEEEKNEEKK